MSITKLIAGVSIITSLPGKQVFKFFDEEERSTEGPVFTPVKDINQVVYDTDTMQLFFNTHYGSAIALPVNFSAAVDRWGTDFGIILVAGFSALLEEFYSGQNIGNVTFLPACFKPVTE